MDLYLAGKVSARFRLRETRDQIESLGHSVVSTWIDTATDYGAEDATPERLVWAGKIDLKEISQASLFIIDTLDESNTGGRETELGYFLAQREFVDINGKNNHQPLWRVGPMRNLYHVFADRTFNSWEECLEALRGIQL